MRIDDFLTEAAKKVIRETLDVKDNSLNESFIAQPKQFNVKTDFLSPGNVQNHIELYEGYVENFKSEAGKQFYEREQLRQKHLINKLKIPHDRLLQYQLKILRFCDDLSLYVCMNKPGAAKEEEVDLFKKGFKDSEFFSKNGETKIIASYREKGRNVIKFNSSPFEEPFEIKVHCKRISKQLINDIGLADAYEAEPVTFFLIQLT